MSLSDLGKPDLGEPDLGERDLGEREQIVRAVSERSDKGYEWLLREVAPRVKGLLVRKFGSGQEEDLDTAIVEAAEALWMRGDPYDPTKGSLVTWLYTPSMRNCVTLFRARAARPLFSSLSNSRIAEEFTTTADEVSPRSTRLAGMLQRLTDAIARLSPGEQKVIRASLEGFSGPDADLGKELGTTDNSVRVLRSRAMKKLSQFMTEPQFMKEPQPTTELQPSSSEPETVERRPDR